MLTLYSSMRSIQIVDYAVKTSLGKRMVVKRPIKARGGEEAECSARNRTKSLDRHSAGPDLFCWRPVESWVRPSPPGSAWVLLSPALSELLVLNRSARNVVHYCSPFVLSIILTLSLNAMSVQPKPKLSFIQLLEREIETFNNSECELLSHQIDGFAYYYDILREDEASSAKNLTKQRHSESQRVRNLLVDIYTCVAQEVFVLSAVAVSIKTFISNTPVELIPALQKWWNGVSKPPGLTRVAKEVCQKYQVNNLVSEIRKRKLEKITAYGNSLHYVYCLILVLIVHRTRSITSSEPQFGLIHIRRGGG